MLFTAQSVNLTVQEILVRTEPCGITVSCCLLILFKQLAILSEGLSTTKVFECFDYVRLCYLLLSHTCLRWSRCSLLFISVDVPKLVRTFRKHRKFTVQKKVS